VYYAEARNAKTTEKGSSGLRLLLSQSFRR
jgi:hypothetical protein